MTEEIKKDPIKLNKPTNVQCTEATETTLTITWSAVERIVLNCFNNIDANDYIVLCKDVLSDSWETCESASICVVSEFTLVTSGETTVVVENLYPTATFEVKVIAASNSVEYCRIESSCWHVANSDDSDVIYCDTVVGSCAPKEKKCCF